MSDKYRYELKLSAEEVGVLIEYHQSRIDLTLNLEPSEAAWRSLRIRILRELCP